MIDFNILQPLKTKCGWPARKPLPVREVGKVPVGTWIEFKWMDSPNTFGILLEKAAPHSQGMLRVLWCKVNFGADGYGCGHATVEQVVAQHGLVKPPNLEEADEGSLDEDDDDSLEYHPPETGLGLRR